MRYVFAALVACFAASATAQELVYDPGQTEACLAASSDTASRHACVGIAANQCMENTPGGFSTVGMGGCLDRERAYWDARLNTVYQDLLAQHADRDPAWTQNLRAMQRAWIPYRDARCDYEYVQWGGGTGGGPAIVACLMHATAEQVFVLEQNLQ